MPGRPILRHDEPAAEAVAALDPEFHVAPLDHHILRGETIAADISVHPGRRATAGYYRPCPGRSARRGRARRSRYAVSPADSPGRETDDWVAAALDQRRQSRRRRLCRF